MATSNRILTKRHILTICLAAAGAIGAWGFSRPERAPAPAAAPPEAMPVSVVRIERAAGYTIEREYTGPVVARRSSDLGFELSGRIQHWHADDGDIVERGAVLAELDTRALTADRDRLRAQLAAAAAALDEMERGPRSEVIAQARAQVAALQAELENWQRKEAKRRDLHRRGQASEEEYDDARFTAAALAGQLAAAEQRQLELENGTRPEQIAAQRARVDELRAALDGIDIQLDKSRLLAPFAGQVTARAVDEGAVVLPGQSIIRLVEHEVLEARTGVSAAAAGLVRVGQRHGIRVGPLAIPAEVTAILPEVEASTRTVTVVWSLEEAAGHGVRPGQLARVALPRHIEEDGFFAPLGALLPAERGLWACFAVVAGPDGVRRVETRHVEVLHTDGTTAFIRGVLRDGEPIVADGAHRLAPGQAVRIVRHHDRVDGATFTRSDNAPAGAAR